MQVERTNHDKKSDRVWRCDMHPAYSRDGQWVVVNGRPGGKNRQVVLIYLDGNLSQYFE
jgi:hypothetical protein